MISKILHFLKALRSQWQNLSFSNNFLILMFFSLGLFGILNHAMWRDELNGWLIARDSKFPLEFIQNIKYEGHPLLWYLCLYLLNQLTSNPVAMQIFHLLLATGSIYIFLKFSPFNQRQKLLFCFGYLPLYEYLLISRNYAIGILLVFAVCSLWKTRRKGYEFLSIVLALMANSNAYCLCLAISFYLTLIVEYIWGSAIGVELTNSLQNLLKGLGIFAIGVVASVVMLFPPLDSTLQGGASQWLLKFDLVQLARTIARIWNSYILIILPSDSQPIDVSLFALISIFLLAFMTTAFIKKPIALFFYLCGTLEILLFTYIKFLGSPRHYGHLYTILIASLWLASYYPQSDKLRQLLAKLPKKWQNLLNKWVLWVGRHKMTAIAIILSAQFAAGIVSFSRDLVLPYSASRETARFIKANELDKMLIVGSEDFAVSPISAYLNRKIFYPEIDSLGSFVLFTSRRQILDEADLLEKVSQVASQREEEILLILNDDIDSFPKDLEISLLAQFTRTFIHNEKYYLYRVGTVTGQEHLPR